MDKDKKIIQHSRGMISMDAEQFETDLKFVEQTQLYQTLVKLVGKERASQAITGAVQSLPSKQFHIKEKN